MPLQGMVTLDMIRRTSQYAEQAQDVAFNPVGQIVGSMNQIKPTKDIVADLIDGYYDSLDRLQSLTPQE